MKQDCSSHRRFSPVHHFVLFPLMLAVVGGAAANLLGPGGTERPYNASLVLALSVVVAANAATARVFALRAQDRAIRAEESLRHYVLTGRLPHAGISMRQMVALRFAPDGEFVRLAARAAVENLTPDEIKRAVGKWREDHDRV